MLSPGLARLSRQEEGGWGGTEHGDGHGGAQGSWECWNSSAPAGAGPWRLREDGLGMWGALVRMRLQMCRGCVREPWAEWGPVLPHSQPGDPSGTSLHRPLRPHTGLHPQLLPPEDGLLFIFLSKAEWGGNSSKCGVCAWRKHIPAPGAEPPRPWARLAEQLRVPGQGWVWISQPCAFAFKFQPDATLTCVTPCL